MKSVRRIWCFLLLAGETGNCTLEYCLTWRVEKAKKPVNLIFCLRFLAAITWTTFLQIFFGTIFSEPRQKNSCINLFFLCRFQWVSWCQKNWRGNETRFQSSCIGHFGGCSAFFNDFAVNLINITKKNKQKLSSKNICLSGYLRTWPTKVNLEKTAKLTAEQWRMLRFLCCCENKEYSNVDRSKCRSKTFPKLCPDGVLSVLFWTISEFNVSLIIYLSSPHFQKS